MAIRHSWAQMSPCTFHWTRKTNNVDEERLYNDQEESVEDEEQGMFEHFRLNVDVGQTPMRVDKYMATHLEDTSRHRVQCAIKEGYVRVNDKVAKANLIIRPGDVIRFVMPYRRRGLESPAAGHSIEHRLRGQRPPRCQQGRRNGRASRPRSLRGDARQRTLLSFRNIPGS